MHIVIRDHILEGDNLDELATCLLRWMPPLVPWMLDLQKEVKEQAGEYGSEGKTLLAIVKANPDKYKIDYQSKDSPFLLLVTKGGQALQLTSLGFILDILK